MEKRKQRNKELRNGEPDTSARNGYKAIHASHEGELNVHIEGDIPASRIK